MCYRKYFLWKQNEKYFWCFEKCCGIAAFSQCWCKIRNRKEIHTETHFTFLVLVGGALNIESKLHQSPIKQSIFIGINVSI